MKNNVSEESIRILVGKNLRRFRELQNISQFNLAIKADLTQNFIADLEKGKKSPSCKTLAKLSSAFKVEPYQFFLPETIADDKFSGYVNDFQNQLDKMVGELTRQYTPKEEE
jgi:transcriptional regulator with XRE-family HTH domain